MEATKQDGVVYKIPCECGKVYVGETGIVRKPPQFRSTLTKRGIFLFGKSLLIVTLTGTHVGSKRLSISRRMAGHHLLFITSEAANLKSSAL